MRIAVLMTNTDETDFAQKHPKDGEKFTSLIKTVRPDWDLDIYSTKDDIFPEDITMFDGVLITGSPASVHEDSAWVPRLLKQIRVAYDANVPMFGACFGHQAIALALGGAVTRNPNGWAFGLLEMQVTKRAPWYDGPTTLLQYGAHVEQVTQLPDGAEAIFSTEGCPVAGFVLADRVYTTQNHPEMTPEFIAALVEEYADKLDADVAERAQHSLGRIADRDAFARSIVRFFEQDPA
ncbi:MAG: type 1 glutamine amidotransferase [Ascidiaceihabitans sp.]|jgi:GMP synthase-like glutamine amidotransferase|nr:glutamine amidotransferase class-I [Rhodobacteraceae bacterium HTCC2083]MDG1448493.1 type 1 glutamine amidotransferase [Ascidiaceihabitans sp.]HCW83345.1 type 1 glutamine amidotransferase [Paracoccaceae bacterium]